MSKASIRSLESKINSALIALPADRRPELSSRRKAQSVAYASRGYFEVSDSSGNTEMVSVETVSKWANA
jgi:hypothetical protein